MSLVMSFFILILGQVLIIFNVVIFSYFKNFYLDFIYIYSFIFSHFGISNLF